MVAHQTITREFTAEPPGALREHVQVKLAVVSGKKRFCA